MFSNIVQWQYSTERYVHGLLRTNMGMARWLIGSRRALALASALGCYPGFSQVRQRQKRESIGVSVGRVVPKVRLVASQLQSRLAG